MSGFSKALTKLGAPQKYLSQKLGEAAGLQPAGSSEENFQNLAQKIAEKISEKTGIDPNSPAVNLTKAVGVAGAEVFGDPLGAIPVGKIAKGVKAASKSDKLQKIMQLISKNPNAPISVNSVPGSGQAIDALKKLGQTGPVIIKGSP